MWPFLRFCFPTSERLIKTIFFLHFTLYLIFLATFSPRSFGSGITVIYNVFLFLALFGTLLPPTKGHHLAHLAGLINVTSILLDYLLFQDYFLDAFSRPDLKLLPFFLNFAFRFLFAVLLFQIGPNDSAASVSLAMTRQDDSLDEIISSDANNNNNRYTSVATEMDGSELTGKLLNDNKSTEV